MNRICLHCGGFVATGHMKVNPYCSTECTDFINDNKPFTIKDSFKIFKNLIAIAENYNEFKYLYKKYFKEM